IRGTVENVQTVTNYAVYRDGALMTTTTGTSYQDHLSATNTYQYTVTANWSNGCTASATKTFTNVASIIATPETVDFYTNYGHGLHVKKVIVDGSGLASSIQATVSGNFLISTDSVNFFNTRTLPAAGGNLFVKYVPTSSTTEFEVGLLTLVSGNISATVSLSGQCSGGCNPPQNLVLSQSGSTVGLSWDAPTAQVITQQPLTWMQSTDYTGFGDPNNSNQRYIVHRFDTDDLAPYHGKQLTAVSFIPHASVTTYRIVVYQGGGIRTTTYLQSGTQVVNQIVNISSLTMGSWNTITLNTPVTIDASQELWYGIYLESPANTYPVYVGTPYVAKKGLITKTASATDLYWMDYLANSNYANTYCFALNSTIEDAPVSLTHYQIDRNGDYVGETNNTSYSDQVVYNGDYDYTVWAFWNNGCRAAVQGSITVTGLCEPTGHAFTEESCDSYQWHGETFTESGDYTYQYTLSGGCPAVDTLHLTIHYGTHNIETETACESYTWNGQTYTTSGTYTFAYTNDAGCASVDTLHLTINYGTHNVETETACESYTWHGTTYTQTGTCTFAYDNAAGCPSVDTLHLTINNPVHQSSTVTAYDSYTWTEGDGETYTTSGTYTYPHADANNCTQVDTLHLTVYYSSTSDIYVTACESYEWNDQTYTASGDYLHHYTDIHGADSAVTLHLTINYGTHNVETETACESYTWHGTTYTTSGTYTFAYNNAVGCPSVDTLHLTINYGTVTDEYITICESELPYIYGDTLFEVGTPELSIFNYQLSSVNGCDSIVTLHLTVNPTYNIYMYDTAVREHDYVFGEFTVTPADSGTYQYDFQYSTAEGCDSVVHLILYVQFNDGIAPYGQPDVEIFPNPTNSILNIKGEDMRQILIYSADGQLVYASDEVSANLKVLDVSRYAAGQYFVKIIFGNKQTVTRKVIVSRK
ncbi:MAG: T9SS type A sorting domain-containing protein, partial [Bacteroidales bacterium]|nr:T9SS type A sorting domain-containing protein [Bacteroidales bacterium]